MAKRFCFDFFPQILGTMNVKKKKKINEKEKKGHDRSKVWGRRKFIVGKWESIVGGGAVRESPQWT